MKLCKKCSTSKPLEQFHRDRGSRDGRTSYCKPCQTKKTRQHYQNNRETIRAKEKARWTPERSRASKDAMLRRKYGMSIEEYEQRLQEQDGVCAICGGSETFKDGRAMPVDHDHKTGRVRGILCNNCNRALGLLKDNPEVLFSAAVYLMREEDTVQAH